MLCCVHHYGWLLTYAFFGRSFCCGVAGRALNRLSINSQSKTWMMNSIILQYIAFAAVARSLRMLYIVQIDFRMAKGKKKHKTHRRNTMISGFFRYLFDFSCVCVRSVCIHLCVIRAHCLFISLINENLPLTRASQWVSERKGDAESETSERKRIISRRQRICMSFVFQFSSINQGNSGIRRISSEKKHIEEKID